MKRVLTILTAAGALAVMPGLAVAQQAKPAPKPSRLQAEVAAEMTAPAPYGVPSAPYGARGSNRPNSQTFGDADASYQVGNLHIAIDAGVEQPYVASWFNNVGGQPASSGHAQVLARAAGIAPE